MLFGPLSRAWPKFLAFVFLGAGSLSISSQGRRPETFTSDRPKWGPCLQMQAVIVISKEKDRMEMVQKE